MNADKSDFPVEVQEQSGAAPKHEDHDGHEGGVVQPESEDTKHGSGPPGTYPNDLKSNPTSSLNANKRELDDDGTEESKVKKQRAAEEHSGDHDDDDALKLVDNNGAEIDDPNKTTNRSMNEDEGILVPPGEQGIEFFGDEDVLSGRGGGTNVHPGNRNFRRLINVHRAAYLVARKNDKPKISRSIIREIRGNGGRFLRRDETNGLWFEIGDNVAREKVAQALRQSAPEIRKILLGRKSSLAGTVQQQQQQQQPRAEQVPVNAQVQQLAGFPSSHEQTMAHITVPPHPMLGGGPPMSSVPPPYAHMGINNDNIGPARNMRGHPQYEPNQNYALNMARLQQQQQQQHVNDLYNLYNPFRF